MLILKSAICGEVFIHSAVFVLRGNRLCSLFISQKKINQKIIWNLDNMCFPVNSQVLGPDLN